MPKIETVYLISHTHTDIGYTDHQETVFRQHLEFIDAAIDLAEATADYPAEARYKWTCEVTSFVERYLRERPPAQVDRFLAAHHRGQMAVAGMAYHWTPLLSRPNMLRSLLPVSRLRHEYNLNISSAMQCDVNGAAWLWADLLPAIGIAGLTMSINMHRGRRPSPDLNAFWWRGPGGGRLLTFNGPHYLYGIFRYGIGDRETTERLLPEQVAKLETREDYPYDFIFAQVTHPARVDNGPPLPGLADFVRDWNADGRSPRMVFVTLDEFVTTLTERYGDRLPTWQGDWADWWADGVASSAYETALNRATEALLPLVDLLSTRVNILDTDLIEEAYHLISLYDEHTWGGFASIRRPFSPFTKANWNRKAGFAYNGYGLTHELLAKGGRKLARDISGVVPEGEAWRRWGQYVSSDPAADAQAQRFMVVNPLAWTRHVRLPLPPDIGGAAPFAVLETFLSDNYRERAPLETDATGNLVIDATLPPFGFTVTEYHQLGEHPAEVTAGEGTLENKWYRLELDPQTGGLRSWYDKELDRELAARNGPWRLGQYVYEWVDHPDDRRAIFALDFDREDFGVRHRDTPFRRRGPSEIEVLPARVEPGAVTTEIRLKAPGIRDGKVRYSLPHHEKALQIEMVFDKEPVTTAEAIYVMFPLELKTPRFHLDLNGVPLEPEKEQLVGSCRDWYGIQRWAEVNDGDISIVLAPLDAPLMQVGGIQTGRWAETLDIRSATLVSWPVHNHWDTNFKASQSEDMLFRYKLTSMPDYDPAAASRFAAEAAVPPLVVRVAGAETGHTGQFVTVEPEGVADVQIKQAHDGRGVIVNGFNNTDIEQTLTIGFPELMVGEIWHCSPIEDDLAQLEFDEGRLHLTVPARSIACARIIPA